MTLQRDLGLGDRQRLALRHADLPGHQVQASDRFGDGVLDLQARVHLHKKELATRIQQKLHRAGAHVADCLSSPHGRLTHCLAHLRGQPGCRRFFDDLLVTALNRAVALVEVQALAVLVGEHLDLHMARLEHVFFDQHARIAERRQRLTLRRGQRISQILIALDHLHAFAAAARRSL